MEWTTQYFFHKSEHWILPKDAIVSPGAAAYAHRQAAL
jgi:hypothetical protein